MQVRRGEVHAVEAVECEDAHAVAASPHLAHRAGAQPDLSRLLRRPARRVGVGHERAVRDVLEPEVP